MSTSHQPAHAVHQFTHTNRVPQQLVDDPDFSLESLLAVDAQIQAWNRYGRDAVLCFAGLRVTCLPPSSDFDEATVTIETLWDVQVPVA